MSRRRSVARDAVDTTYNRLAAEKLVTNPRSFTRSTFRPQAIRYDRVQQEVDGAAYNIYGDDLDGGYQGGGDVDGLPFYVAHPVLTLLGVGGVLAASVATFYALSRKGE